MPLSAVIFDLDGVLVHTDRYHFLAWQAMADSLGLTFDEQLNHRLRGVSRMESLRLILEANSVHLSPEQQQRCAAEKNGLYRSYLQKMTPADVPSEVWRTLRALQDMGLKIAVGSSSKNARLILDLTGLAAWFKVVVDGNNITHSKPNPEIFLLAARRLGEEPAHCLVVEDAQAGIDAAIAGGFSSAAIGPARSHPGPSLRLERLDDLIAMLPL